jgi:hypothetical protein
LVVLGSRILDRLRELLGRRRQPPGQADFAGGLA